MSEKRAVKGARSAVTAWREGADASVTVSLAGAGTTRAKARSTHPGGSAANTPTVADAISQLLHAMQNPLAGAGELEKQTEGLRQELDEGGLAGGLSSNVQFELAQLVIALTRTTKVVEWIAPLRQERKRWIKHGRGYIKVLTRKTKAALSALEDVREYLATISFDRTPPIWKRLTFQSLPHGIQAVLATAITALDPAAVEALRDRLPDLLSGPASAEPLPKRPDNTEPPDDRDDGLVALYRFFTQHGIKPGEAEVRVATISNAYWDTAYVIADRNSDGEQSRGCDAIRNRVRSRKRDTSEKPA